MSSMPPKLLGIEDAARATGLTAKALRRRIERGTLSSVRANGRRWIAMDELLRRGLLVPLDTQIRSRELPPPANAGYPALGVLVDRLEAIERRLTAHELALDSLLARIEIGAIGARVEARPAPPAEAQH